MIATYFGKSTCLLEKIASDGEKFNFINKIIKNFQSIKNNELSKLTSYRDFLFSDSGVQKISLEKFQHF